MDKLNQFVIFKTGAEEYAIPILKVNEIIRLKEINITEVPNTQKYIMGIINLRGEVIPIIDLRMKFNMPRKELDDSHRIIIVNFQEKSVGFMVDSVSEVAEIDEEDITQPPEEISDINSRYITGIAKYKDRIFIILDIDIIISDKEISIKEG
ncbi:MAG TPA: purine-binding chemotaxis protein CheW [Clostridiales bacterium]|nr:purine-binding chemotaxis protein CheW [Clostridiales bacterium]